MQNKIGVVISANFMNLVYNNKPNPKSDTVLKSNESHTISNESIKNLIESVNFMSDKFLSHFLWKEFARNGINNKIHKGKKSNLKRTKQ